MGVILPLISGPSGDLEAVLNHIDYIVNLAGIDCVGGFGLRRNNSYPAGLEMSQMPNITGAWWPGVTRHRD